MFYKMTRQQLKIILRFTVFSAKTGAENPHGGISTYSSTRAEQSTFRKPALSHDLSEHLGPIVDVIMILRNDLLAEMIRMHMKITTPRWLESTAMRDEWLRGEDVDYSATEAPYLSAVIRNFTMVL